MNIFLFEEAIHSISLEHPGECECKVCLAARGDKKVWVELYLASAEAFDQTLKRA